MSFPSKLVLKSLLETYLQARKNTWHLVNQRAEVELPVVNDTAMHKIKTCIELFRKFDTCRNTSAAWIDVIKELDKLEKEEGLTFFNRIGATSPYLTNTLQAARSYIAHELQENGTFKEHVDNLLRRQQLLEIKKSKSIEENKDLENIKYELNLLMPSHHHTAYFDDVIKPYNSEGITSESNFADYASNIENKVRKLPLLDKINTLFSAHEERLRQLATMSTSSAKKSPLQAVSTFRPRAVPQTETVNEEKVEEKPGKKRRGGRF